MDPTAFSEELPFSFEVRCLHFVASRGKVTDCKLNPVFLSVFAYQFVNIQLYCLCKVCVDLWSFVFAAFMFSGLLSPKTQRVG